MRYTYETQPGQTIIRTAPEGYDLVELLEELTQNSEGVLVTTDEGRDDAFTNAMAGKTVRGGSVQTSSHGAGKRSVQVLRDGQLVLDLNM